ncbi:MAG TPA: cytochrome c nitrite reductase small subunit [Candidatus Krumholzibacterium sp.]|nr:cytochrome c nitrite reductase small subunit [Candidatus Krumholzibacterium sp.]
MIDRKVVRSLFLLSGLSRGLQVGVYMSIGLVIGMAAVVFRVANAVSYLNEEPETCANCHVMTDVYASWQRGSHGGVAVCTDCHLPHSNIIAKTAFKGTDGLRHSFIFTVGTEPQVMEPSRGAVPVIQANCIRCHPGQFSMIRLAQAAERTCWDCHENIHTGVRSQSASPVVLRPEMPDAGWHPRRKEADR